MALCASLLISGCGGGSAGTTGKSAGSANSSFTVGGTVSGINGSVVLQNNGGDRLTIFANGAFAFDHGIPTGGAYSVTVSSQPSGQTCSVSSGAGTVATTDVTNVAVVCANNANAYSIGGTMAGLSGTVVLQNNGGDNLSVSTNGPLTFSTLVANNSPYNVTVLTQPAGQNCSIVNGAGTVASANVADISITCASDTYTVGGSVSGLVGTIALQNNGGNSLYLTSNGPFSFATASTGGSAYNVTVGAQPMGQMCVVNSGAGTISTSNITNVSVVCTSYSYTIGGAVSGLNNTVVLQNNGGNNLAISANGPFQFSAKVAYANPYNVTVLTQPAGQNCSVSNGGGTVNLANVSNVGITCSSLAYTVGGTRTGIASGTVVLQNNGGDDLSLGANGNFQFATTTSYGASYNVTVLSKPASLTCPIANGSGTVSNNVSNVSLVCACDSGFSDCSGNCVDTQTDASHCGGCGNVCAGGRICVAGSCLVPATCSDGIKNGNESDVDCGGSCANKCSDGQVCAMSSDCLSSVCFAGVCQTASCADGVKNGSESDIDCGGSCAKCAVGRQCSAAADCVSGVCNAGTCQ